MHGDKCSGDSDVHKSKVHMGHDDDLGCWMYSDGQEY